MARYDRSFDPPLRFRTGRPGPMRGYDRSFGGMSAAGLRPPMGRYDREFRGYDRGFRGAYDDPFRSFREEAARTRGASNRPMRGSESGGIFDPYSGPFRPDAGLTGLGAGRPNFFTDYGGGEQAGGRRGRGWL